MPSKINISHWYHKEVRRTSNGIQTLTLGEKGSDTIPVIDRNFPSTAKNPVIGPARLESKALGPSRSGSHSRMSVSAFAQ